MNRRPPATSVRARKYGMANQIAYQQSERAERQGTIARMAASKAAARAAAPKKQSQTGMNAGTIGGSWLAKFKR